MTAEGGQLARGQLAMWGDLYTTQMEMKDERGGRSEVSLTSFSLYILQLFWALFLSHLYLPAIPLSLSLFIDSLSLSLSLWAFLENYTYTSYADSGESSPRSRELEFENSGTASWEDQPLHQSSKVKFMCSYGGKIQPCPHDN